MKTITITLKSPEEVLDEIKQRLPASTFNTEVKGSPNPWVWLTGTKSSDKETNAVLKDIGFKWSAKRSAWYHSCETDTTKRRSFGRRRGGYNKSQAYNTNKSEPKKTIQRYQPTTNVSDEFAKRFANL